MRRAPPPPPGLLLGLLLLAAARGCAGLTVWEELFVTVPEAAQAKAVHARYTSMIHVAGTANDRAQAYETAANMTRLGLAAQVEVANVALSYPTAIPQLRITNGAQAGYRFNLSEMAVEEDPDTTTDWRDWVWNGCAEALPFTRSPNSVSSIPLPLTRTLARLAGTRRTARRWGRWSTPTMGCGRISRRCGRSGSRWPARSCWRAMAAATAG